MENTIAHIIGRAIINVVMMDVKTIAEAAKVILPECEFDVKLISDDTAELINSAISFDLPQILILLFTQFGIVIIILYS